MAKRAIAWLTAAMFAGCCAAQTPNGWQEGSPLNGFFDPDRVYVFTARIIGVEVSAPRKDVSVGVTLLVRLGDGRCTVVDLGPQVFLETRGLTPRIGETIEFAGSSVFEGGSYGYVASRLSRGKTHVTLRTPAGKPLWIASN